MDATKTTYLVPTGDGASIVQLDVGEIVKAEERLKDVAIVNNFNAPEMMAFFNDIWLKLNRTVVGLAGEKNTADNAHRKARAEAKLNCTDDAIKARGHAKASADLRDAFVELDGEVIKTKDRLDEITVVHAILLGKQQAFYNAYGAVKRMVDSRTLPGPSYGDSNRPAPYQPPPSRYGEETSATHYCSPPQQKPVVDIGKVEYNEDFDLPPGFKPAGSR